jgi:Immunoglobulin I-set domain
LIDLGEFIAAAPVLIERPSDQTAYEDDAVEFACSTDGYPSPFITWLKGGTPLVPDARTAIGQTRMRIEQVPFICILLPRDQPKQIFIVPIRKLLVV